MPHWARDGMKAMRCWRVPSQGVSCGAQSSTGRNGKLYKIGIPTKATSYDLYRCEMEWKYICSIVSINATIDSSRRNERGRGLQNLCIVKNIKARLISHLALRSILERVFFVVVQFNKPYLWNSSHFAFFRKDFGLSKTTGMATTLLMSVR